MSNDDHDRLSYLPRYARAGAAMLHEVWQEVLTLNLSRDTWDELRVGLVGYDNAGGLIGMWYCDHVLTGCRRLLDDGGDATSVVRALRLIARDAATLDFDALLRAVRRHEDPGYAETMTRRALERVGCSDGVDAAVIEDTILRLRAEHRIVRDLATRRIVHRLDDKPVGPVDWSDIDNLVTDVFETVQSWYGLLACVHLTANDGSARGTTPAATALRLFDWREYVLARSEAMRRIGPTAGPERYQRQEDGCRLRYEFPDEA